METDKPSNGEAESVKEKEGEKEKEKEGEGEGEKKSPEEGEETKSLSEAKTEGSEVKPEDSEVKGKNLCSVFHQCCFTRTTFMKCLVASHCFGFILS